VIEYSESHWYWAALDADEIHLYHPWFGRADSCGLFCTWTFMVTRGNDHCLYFGIMVFSNWYGYESNCFDLTFDWKELSMPARPRYPMPDSIRDALDQRGLMDAYRSRPAYQQNDYIGTLRVTRAKREVTRQKRLNQMLDELKSGNVYMNMKWHPK
jgi:hypothetical protein